MKKGIDFIGISTVFFCHDGNGKFVLAKRSQRARDEQGRWDCGAGGAEWENSIEDNLKHEIKEEYGADVLQYEFLGYRDVFRKHEEQTTHWVTLDFKVLVDPAQVKICEPHKFDELGWFTVDNLPEPLHSQLPIFLKKYKNRL